MDGHLIYIMLSVEEITGLFFHISTVIIYTTEDPMLT